MKKIIISATDTGVGKTAACEWLCKHLSLHSNVQYIKPIQCGPGETIDGITNSGDAENIKSLPSNVSSLNLIYLKAAASPHLASEKENIEITLDSLLNKINLATSPDKINIIEGAGGVLVPINRNHTLIDLFTELQIPLIIIVRSGLGTINHSLLTLQTLRTYKIPVLGFMSAPGDSSLFEDNMRTIEDFSKTPYLGQVPHLKSTLADDTNYFQSIWKRIEKQYQLIEAT